MAHIHEKIDWTVEVCVVYKDKVLLRKHDKYKIWLTIGGHIELNEDPTQAAVREVKEEVGLDVTLVDDLLKFKIATPKYTELIPPKFLNRHPINDTHEHISLTYFARATSDTVIPEKPTDEWRWFTLQELEENKEGMEERVLNYAKQALRELAS